MNGESIAILILIIMIVLWVIASRFGRNGCFNPNRRPSIKNVRMKMKEKEGEMEE